MLQVLFPILKREKEKWQLSLKCCGGGKERSVFAKLMEEEEEKKKSYPSLPSNYVTLAQLQERWLKQQSQINQPQQPQEDQPKQQQQQVAVVVAPTKNVTVSRSSPSDRKNRGYSATNRRATDVARIGDETADLNGKVGESKKKKKSKSKRKHKGKERKASGEGTEAAQGNEGAEKTTIESELNDKKNCNTTTVVEEVEKKLGVLSMNSGNGKQNEGSRRMNDDSHRSQSQRNHRGGYSYGKFRGQQQRYEVKMQRRKKMVWVKKDGSVGETES